MPAPSQTQSHLRHPLTALLGSAGQVRKALMPVEDAQQVRLSLTALTAKELAALPDDDAWWANVNREGRVLKGAAPEQTRQRLARAAT